MDRRHLLHPPPEMLLKDTLPRAVQDLSLTCKTPRGCAENSIIDHDELREKYHSFSFMTSDLDTVPELLAEIAANPIIATYMVHVDLQHRGFLQEDELDDEYIEEMTDTIEPLVRGSTHLSSLGGDEEDELGNLWLEEIVRNEPYDEPYENLSEGDDDFDGYEEYKKYEKVRVKAEFSIPFLASLLTNVETLTLPKRWCHPELFTRSDIRHPVTEMMRLLVARANDNNLQDQPLHKLREIRPTDISKRNTDLAVLFPFLALDSLRVLHHRSGTCIPGSTDARRPFTTLGRNLERMTLEDFVISVEGAKLLVKDMENLRVLDIEYNMKDEHEFRFDATDFIWELMEAPTRRNLEKLTLSARQVWPVTVVLKCSLGKFESLKHLVLNTVFLVNGIGAIGTRAAWDFEGTIKKEADENIDTEVEEGSDEDEGEVEDETMHDEPASGHDDEGQEDETMYDEPGDSDDSDDTDDYDDYKGQRRETRARFLELVLKTAPFHRDDKIKYYTSGNPVWRLVSALPESLETLVIETPAARRNSACVERMFWRFEELRAERLPNLKRIELSVQLTDCDGWEAEVSRLEAFFDGKNILSDFQVR